MLVAELGYERTSLQTGIKAGTLRQWSARFGWKTPIIHSQQTVTTVTKPADILADELAENERETRLSLSRYARRAAKDSESATLKDSPYVKQAAQVASIAHQWDANKQGNTFSLNILNINSLSLDQESTTD